MAFFIKRGTKMYIEKTKNGKYKFVETYKDFMNNTKRISVTLDKNTKQSQFEAYKILQDKISKKLNYTDTELTVHECLEKYSKYVEENLKKSTVLTVKIYISWMKKNILDMKMNTLTTKNIHTIFDENKDNIRYKYFKIFINWCYQRGFIENINFLNKFKAKNKKTTSGKKLYLEHEEIDDILKYFEKDKLIQVIIQILLNTGLRIGELQALTYEDIQDGYINITKDYYKGMIQPPKTETSIRKIAINKEVEALFEEVRKLETKTKCVSIKQLENTYIFKSKDSLKPLNYNNLLKRLKSYPSIKLHFHLFRHTHASLLIEKGVSVGAVSRRLGHNNTKITEEIYIHMTKKLKEQDDMLFKNLKIV